MKAQSPVMMDEPFPVRHEEESEIFFTMAWQMRVVLLWENMYPYSPRNNQRASIHLECYCLSLHLDVIDKPSM
jgi:hypothetical protein